MDLRRMGGEYLPFWPIQMFRRTDPRHGLQPDDVHSRATLLPVVLLALVLTGCTEHDIIADSGNINVDGVSVLTNYNEDDFASSPDLRANPDDIITLQLEGPAGSSDDTLDTGDSMGVDVVPYTFLETVERTFCWQVAGDESATGSGSEMRLIDDATGTVVLEVEEGGECVTHTIPAGNYSAYFYHGPDAEQERDLVFIVPQAGASPLNSQGSGAGPDQNPSEGGDDPTPYCQFAVLTSPDYIPPFLPAGLVVTQVIDSGLGRGLFYLPSGGCTDASLILDNRPRRNESYQVGVNPGFKLRIYHDLFYRGPRKTLNETGFFSFPGPASMVFVVGDPDKNKDWLIFTNGCVGCDLSGLNLDGVNLSRAWLHQADLSHASLERANLSNALALQTVFKSAYLGGVDLRGADLTGALFDSAGVGEGGEVFPAADLSDADLAGALLKQTVLRGATLTRARLTGVTAEGTDFTRISAAEANFQDANLRSAVLTNATLSRAQFDRAILDAANLQGASLDEARLPGASLIGAFLNRGRALQGAFLDDAYMYNVNLDTADLTGVSMRGARFYGPQARAVDARFDVARLDQAVLSGTNFTRAFFQSATLDRATCVNCKFSDARLGATSSELSDAASFVGTDVRGADFTNATVDGCRFSDAIVSFGPGPYSYQAPGHTPYTLGYQASIMGAVRTSETVRCPDRSQGPCDTREKLTARQPTPTATLRPPTPTPATGCTQSIPRGTYCPTGTPTPVP